MIAIIEPNTLANIGLKQVLEHVMPIISIEAFSTFDDFEAAGPSRFFHYFVAQAVVLTHKTFFEAHQHITIVLTPERNHDRQLSGFHSFCINQPEETLVKEILRIEQYGHHGGKNLPAMPQVLTSKILSNRDRGSLAHRSRLY